MIEKRSITAPRSYDPGKGRPKEHLAYLNKGEMAALRQLNGNNMERGPGGLPSFPPADAIGSSSRASSSGSTTRAPAASAAAAKSSAGAQKSSSSTSRISGGTAGSNMGSYKSSNPGAGSYKSSDKGGVSARAPAASAAAAKASSQSRTPSGTGSKDTSISRSLSQRDTSRAFLNTPSLRADAGKTVNVGPMGTPIKIGGGPISDAVKRGYAGPPSMGEKKVSAPKVGVKPSNLATGMSFTPPVMRGIGSILVGGGPGAPKVLSSPGYETYYVDKNGNRIPAGNILSNNLKENPVATTGIRTLSGAGPVDYYRAAQSIEFRPIPRSELGVDVLGYMNPQVTHGDLYETWNPKVVVDNTKKYPLAGFQKPIKSPTGVGYGAISYGDLSTLGHELQHVGQYSHLLAPKNFEYMGRMLDTDYVTGADIAYDPQLGRQGFENMNVELDLLDSDRRGVRDPVYKIGNSYISNDYLRSASPGYLKSETQQLAREAAKEMERESEWMIKNDVRPEADRYTLQTLSRGAGENARYVPSSVRNWVKEDLIMLGLAEP